MRRVFKRDRYFDDFSYVLPSVLSFSRKFYVTSFLRNFFSLPFCFARLSLFNSNTLKLINSLEPVLTWSVISFVRLDVETTFVRAIPSLSFFSRLRTTKTDMRSHGRKSLVCIGPSWSILTKTGSCSWLSACSKAKECSYICKIWSIHFNFSLPTNL